MIILIAFALHSAMGRSVHSIRRGKLLYKKMNPNYIKKVLEKFPQHHKLAMMSLDSQRTFHNWQEIAFKQHDRKQKLNEFYSDLRKRQKLISK